MLFSNDIFNLKLIVEVKRRTFFLFLVAISCFLMHQYLLSKGAFLNAVSNNLFILLDAKRRSFFLFLDAIILNLKKLFLASRLILLSKTSFLKAFSTNLFNLNLLAEAKRSSFNIFHSFELNQSF